LVVYRCQTLWLALSFHPQPQPLHFAVGKIPPVIVEKRKFDHIEERLRAIEGDGDYTFANMVELCLVSDIVIPAKFKVSNFDKYKGTWQLKNLCKKEHESFKEYAQRSRDQAAQVAPLMTKKEMITMIIDTLPVFYYEKLVGYMTSSFADLVFANERIEVGLRRGKFDYPAFMNRNPEASGENKKEGGTHVVTVVPIWPNFPPTQQYQYSANINPSHYPPPYQPRTLNHP